MKRKIRTLVTPFLTAFSKFLAQVKNLGRYLQISKLAKTKNINFGYRISRLFSSRGIVRLF